MLAPTLTPPPPPPPPPPTPPAHAAGGNQHDESRTTCSTCRIRICIVKVIWVRLTRPRRNRWRYAKRLFRIQKPRNDTVLTTMSAVLDAQGDFAWLRKGASGHTRSTGSCGHCDASHGHGCIEYRHGRTLARDGPMRPSVVDAQCGHDPAAGETQSRDRSRDGKPRRRPAGTKEIRRNHRAANDVLAAARAVQGEKQKTGRQEHGEPCDRLRRAGRWTKINKFYAQEYTFMQTLRPRPSDLMPA